MKKFINTLALIVSLTLYCAIVIPLALGGFALFGNFVTHTLMPSIGISMDNIWVTLVVVLTIILPVAIGWSYFVAMQYIKAIVKIDKPFITVNKPVYKTI